MARFCNDECKETGAICDFCRFYDFNGDKRGAYTGDGFCNKLNEQKDPEDGFGCDEFICFKINDNVDNMQSFAEWYNKTMRLGEYKFTPESYNDEINHLQAQLDWYDREISGHLSVTPEFMAKRNSVAIELDKLLQAKERAKDNE